MSGGEVGKCEKAAENQGGSRGGLTESERKLEKVRESQGGLGGEGRDV